MNGENKHKSNEGNNQEIKKMESGPNKSESFIDFLL